MYLFAAGGNIYKGKDYGTYCAEQDVHKLYSINGELGHIHNYDHPWLKMLYDSGGHIFNKGSGGINPLGHGREEEPPDPYEWLEYFKQCFYELRNKNACMFELDIYGHLPKDTIDAVYRELSSIKGNLKLIRCFHPLGIDGDYSLRTLKKWIDEGQDYIAISKSSDVCFREIFKLTMPNKVKVHGLALTGFTYLSRLPFFSADSTNATVTPFKNNTVILDLNKKINLGQALDERSVNHLLYKDFETHLVQSIKMFKRAEEFYSRLWESRGITWK